MKPISFLIIGAGDRGNAYSKYSKKYPKEMYIKAIAEPREDFKNSFIKEYNINKDFTFHTWEEALKGKKIADAVIITTQDQMHCKPAIQALKMGYDVLVEKPMATTINECKKMVEASKKYKNIFGICHVLRYTNYYRKLKELVDSQCIGEVATIEHIEGVQYFHQAHSFVRGNWRNKSKSSPMILSKSCHDMDILRWLIGKPCKKISSFGSLLHFKKENAPKGSTYRCIDGCKVEKNCPYSALKIYLDPKDTGWPINVISRDTSLKMRKEAIANGPYGRCVYRCDNDVVDHQVVICEFESGITASFTMTAFTSKGNGRRTRIMGTKGEIVGDSQFIEISDFLTNKVKKIDTLTSSDSINDGHGGGDTGIMKDFIKAVQHQDRSYLSSSIETSLESHIMAFYAEESRLKNKTFLLDKK